MKKIIVIGLGPGEEKFLTLEAYKHLQEKNKTFLRTEKHPIIRFLKEENFLYESYDYIYEREDSFGDVYKEIVKELLEEAEKNKIINYCVPGHPLMAEKTVEILLKESKKNNVSVEIVNGLSFIEPIVTLVNRDPVEGLKIIDGLDIKRQKTDINVDNLITQVYNRERASELKLELAEVYGDEYEIYIIKSAGIESDEVMEKIKIYELDRLAWIDHLTSIYIPKVESYKKEIYDFHDLTSIMKLLRSDEGCSWDIKQTHYSLKNYVIEEAYELVDAIENKNMDDIKEELGDLLLQIVFYSEIASEDGYFNIYDVIRGISEKMINRHPKVFECLEKDRVEVEEAWDDIKAREKQQSSYQERLKDVPRALPSLIRSDKVQKRASKAGFDWEDVKGPLSKVEEEIVELKENIEKKDKLGMEDELGDLLFSIVNLARHLDINSERALYHSTDKFIDRFSKLEDRIVEEDKEISDLNLSELDKIWDIIKTNNGSL